MVTRVTFTKHIIYKVLSKKKNRSFVNQTLQSCLREARTLCGLYLHHSITHIKELCIKDT